MVPKDFENQEAPEANFGFWDQRLALEWTYDNIASFGGNKNNIIVGGLSAGAYSALHQLAHDIGPNCKRQIIRRVMQFSNGCGVQPKPVSEALEQSDILLSTLGIPRTWSVSKRMEAIRGKTPDELVNAVGRMDQKFFRPVLDSAFISKDLFANIYNGNFGRRMKDLGIQITIGDLTQEFHLYKKTYPPNSYQSLVDRLSWDYPRDIVLAVCSQFKPLNSSPPRSADDWIKIFGHLYADLQIHSTMRGFVQSIARTLPLSNIHRYRIDWRTRSVDKRLPRNLGATHATDMSIWFFGNGDVLTSEEKALITRWLQPVSAFIKGNKVDWGTETIKQVRYLTADGKIEVKDDEWWNTKLPLWDLTQKATVSQRNPRDSKL
jgi:carboxylesterase type B